MFSALVVKHLRQVRMTAAFAAAMAAAFPLIPFAHRDAARALEGAVRAAVAVFRHCGRREFAVREAGPCGCNFRI